MTHLTLDTTKYSKDGPFRDPVVRCDSCQRLIFKDDIQKHGGCPCGSKRIRNVQSFTPDEHALMVGKHVDPDFLALFEEVNENA